ncbi:MAG: CRISPR-associated endonuclease Cas2 [Puniceicoccaceae bacterium]|nr:CRISPR-associated endonuclease Cas2 [Puniceicoccaceae bacterium]|tara:strand:- start:7650 stop:7940 length:291 start_codon:yes stop_codon:yes gene_type:complete
MRRNFFVTYDICDPKRLRKVFKICKGYGIHLQLSVFECDLTESEKVQFETKLHEVIHHEEDQVLFVDLGVSHARGERTVSSIGLQYSKMDAPCYVV